MINKRALLLFAVFQVVCLLVPAGGWAADGNPPGAGGVWAQFQNDLYNDGVTSDPAPVHKPAIGWRQQATGAMASVNVTPLVAGGSVFVLDANGQTWAFDAGTGVQQWAVQLSSAKQKLQLTTPAYDNGRLYAATNDGHVYALDAATGNILWDQTMPLVSESSQLSTPVKYAGGKLYVGAWNPDANSDEYYYCLDAATGSPGIGSSFQVPQTASPGGYYWAGACIADRCLIFGSDRSMLTCLDKDTGALLDSVDLTGIVPEAREIRSSVSYDPVAKLLFLTDQAQSDGSCWAFGLDPDTGKLTHKWHTRLGFSTSTPAVYNGRLYVGTGIYSARGGVYCLDEQTGAEIWKFVATGEAAASVPGVQASPAVSVQSGTPYIYFPTSWENSSVFCLDQNGKQVWQFDDKDFAYAHQGVAAADGWLYFVSNYGLHALKPAPEEPVTGISLDRTTATIAIGASIALTAAIAPADAAGQGITWSSDNIEVTAVDQAGMIAGVSKGAATITATTADGGFTATCAVTVKEVEEIVPVTGVSLDQTAAEIDVGATKTLTGTVAPDNATDKRLAWTSDNTAVATVDQDGAVTGVSAGSATITAATAEGGFTAGCLVKVTGSAAKMITVHMMIKKQSGEVLFDHEMTVQQGQTVMDVLLAAAGIDPAIDPKVDWECPYITGGYVWSICGLDSPFGERSDGWVYFVNDVMPNVGAAIFGKPNYKLLNDGDKIIWRWSWMQPVTSVALSRTTADIPVGQSETLSVILNPTSPNNTDVAWSSSDASVATVDSNGRVTVVGPGTATITATTADGGFTASAVINGPLPEETDQAVAPPGAGTPEGEAPEVAPEPQQQPEDRHLLSENVAEAATLAPPAVSPLGQGGQSMSQRIFQMSATVPQQQAAAKDLRGYAAAILLALLLYGAARQYKEYVKEVAM